MPSPVRFPSLLRALAATLVLAGAAGAQGNRFAPVAEVNDGVVTRYEVDQRVAFNEALNAPPDGPPEEAAIESLIDDRVRMQAARRFDLVPSESEIAAGMEEFAGRADLGVEEFVQALGEEGIARETFRDFVEARIAWREVVAQRFGPRVQITDSEIDRALALGGGQAGAQIRLAEIILPANTPERQARAQELAAELSAEITSESAFTAAAREYSAAPSRQNGGLADWRDLSELPPQLAELLLTLAPGETSEPVPLQNAIAVFQLRGLQETGSPRGDASAIEYARYVVAGGRSAAAGVASRVDTCDDLYGVARDAPAERLVRETRPVAEIPAQTAAELERLDAGEISTGLSSGATGVVLMLCERTTAATAEADRGEVRAQLRNERLSSYAESYLAELRADAIIRR